MVVRKHHVNEVELILDDIRDTLAPQKNPDCTFITRRHDKRLQERLIELSAKDDPKEWASLVYSRDQEQTAVGWQNVIPYPKYVEKRAASKEPAKRARHTNPVDNSTIVRHLQERIRKWADRKPSRTCLYTRKSYSMSPGSSYATQSKVALISSVELPLQETDQPPSCLSVKRSASHEGANSDKLPVSWNILSQNDAAHLNLQTYGMDPNVTYVPARRLTSHINNYTASKQFEQEQRTVARHQQLYGLRSGGVLHPAKAPRYRSRKQGFRTKRHADDHTMDITEESEDHTAAGTLIKYRDKFKCSICIEGLQVAEGDQDLHMQYNSLLPEICKPLPAILFEPNWPTNIEYSQSNARAALNLKQELTAPGPSQGATSDSLTSYKLDKAPGSMDSKSNTSLALVTSGDQSRSSLCKTSSVVQLCKTNSVGQLYHGPTSFRNEHTPRPDQTRGRILDLKQLVIKERVNPSAARSARINNRKKQTDHSMALSGRGTEKKPLRKSDHYPKLEQPPSLSDRFQFQSSKSGRRQRKMYGVSICDVYESKQEPDVFNYGLFLTTPLATPPNKHKLDPLMNIKPLNYINNLKSH